MFSGSIIRRGEIDGFVYGTGMNTYFGKTAQLVEEAHTVSHFQKAVLHIGDYLIFLAGGLVALIVVVAFFRGDPIFTTLAFALVLLVRRYSGRNAYGFVSDYGGRRAATRKKRSDCYSTVEH